MKSLFIFLLLIYGLDLSACLNEEGVDGHSQKFLPYIRNGGELIEIGTETAEVEYIPSDESIPAELCSYAKNNDFGAFNEILKAEIQEARTSVRAIYRRVKCGNVDGSDYGSLLKAAILGSMRRESEAILRKLIKRENNIDLEVKEPSTVRIENGKAVIEQKTILEWLEFKINRADTSDYARTKYRKFHCLIKEELAARKKLTSQNNGQV